MELTAFVSARLDEQEQAARSKWTVRQGATLRWSGALDQGYYMVETSGGQRIMPYDKFNAEYMDPDPDTEMLAQVAAMRAIVAEYERLDSESDRSDGLADLAVRVAAAAAARDAVRHLAAIWRGHDDYDPSWAPEKN